MYCSSTKPLRETRIQRGTTTETTFPDRSSQSQHHRGAHLSQLSAIGHGTWNANNKSRLFEWTSRIRALFLMLHYAIERIHMVRLFILDETWFILLQAGLICQPIPYVAQKQSGSTDSVLQSQLTIPDSEFRDPFSSNPRSPLSTKRALPNSKKAPKPTKPVSCIRKFTDLSLWISKFQFCFSSITTRIQSFLITNRRETMQSVGLTSWRGKMRNWLKLIANQLSAYRGVHFKDRWYLRNSI